MKAARRRELRARWMLEQGHEMTARESFFTAAALYGMAQWPIYANTDNRACLPALPSWA